MFSGENISLDANDWDFLDGVFTHLIRNSIDHGIEAIEERFGSEKKC